MSLPTTDSSMSWRCVCDYVDFFVVDGEFLAYSSNQGISVVFDGFGRSCEDMAIMGSGFELG